MRHEVKKKASITALSVGIILLLASTANGTGFVDRLRTIAEQAWQDEYIPDSGIPTTPLTDFDDFEVTELFRAVTIEDLETSITDGYPMPWLEESLKDESIPWEDRYWLDCRMRAAIAQNTHTFYNPAGSQIHIDADAVFPGELYWREHMIVDPAGWNVPDESIRPEAAELLDIGHSYTPYGRLVGDLPFAIPQMSMSRDGKLCVMSTGNNSPNTPNEQPYACFMYSDGSFLEIPLEELGMYSAAISQDGSVSTFSCMLQANLENPGYIYVFNNDCTLQRTVNPQTPLDWCWRPTISSDGNFLCHPAYGAGTYLVNCFNGTSNLLTSLVNLDEQVTSTYSFSPDNKVLNLGGSTIGRTINMENGEITLYDETGSRGAEEHPFTIVCSSNNSTCTTWTTRRESGSEYSNELGIYIGNEFIHSLLVPSEHDSILLNTISFLQTEVSPNGKYLFLNPADAYCGYPTTHGYSELYNLPVLVIQIEGR